MSKNLALLGYVCVIIGSIDSEYIKLEMSDMPLTLAECNMI